MSKKISREACLKALEQAGGNKSGAAKLLGIPRSTLRMKVGPAEVSKLGKVEISIEEEHKLKRENTALKQQLRDVLEEKEKIGDVDMLVSRLEKLDSNPPAWVAPKRASGPERTIITATLSDTHYDEVVAPDEINYVNAYSREIATGRTERFFGNLVELSRDYISGVKVDGLVMPLLGDMVSGNIHDELRETNEDTMINTCLYYSDLIIAGIEMSLDHFDKIFIPCVVGNHGRMDKKPKAKRSPTESFDYLIYHLIARAFKGVDEVSMSISEGRDFRYNVYDTRYQLTHGDQFRGGSGISGMLSPLMIGDHRKRKREMATGTPYDYLVMGHWHQLAHFKGIIVNGSLKGYDEYAARGNFDFEPPQQALWLTDPKWGKTINAPIHVLGEKEGWEQAGPTAVGF